MMQGNFRKNIIRTVTFLAGLYYFLEYILPKTVLEKIGVEQAHESITNGFIVVGVMAVGLGLINLFSVYGSRIVFKRKGWFNSIALLGSLIFMLTVTTSDWVAQERITDKVDSYANMAAFAKRIIKDDQDNIKIVPDKKFRISKFIEATSELAATQLESLNIRKSLSFEDGKDKLQYVGYLSDIETKQGELKASLVVLAESMSDDSLLTSARLIQELGVLEGQVMRLKYRYSSLNNLWRLLFDGLFVALGAAMFSLLGVYIATAAFRAFRIRSFESALMMLAAVLVMLGQIPFGVWVYSEMPEVRDWILRVPNSAAFRAITIGTAIAGLVMAFRMWFSIESDFGSEDF